MCLRASKRWNILDNFNYIVPRSNCIGEKTILVSGGLTSYFVNDIRVKKSLYKGLQFGGSLSVSRKKSSCF